VSVETLEPLNKPQVAAQAAGLRYVTDQMPGISRRKSGAGFCYIYPTGELVKEQAVLERIKSLVIPPAWSDVWICPDPAGHLQSPAATSVAANKVVIIHAGAKSGTKQNTHG